MKKILFFITDNYPFGHGESFIENEIDYLSQSFKRVFIISKNINDKQTRKVPKNCEVFRIKKSYKNLLNVFRDKNYLMDFIKNFDLKNLKKLISFQYYSKLIENNVLKIIDLKNLNKEEITFYSYWFYNGAYTGSILKRKNIVSKVISRAHRYDLYLEENYQPFKNEILQCLDALLACSKEGEEYLKKYYSKYTDKIKYSYLGTVNKKKLEFEEKENIIVSCSYLVKVKRVELIIEALSQVKDKNILWYHLGNGILEKNIKKLAKEKLKNISYEFIGQIKNEEVLNFYRNKKVKCLINLSSSEGLPVSMMEAQSFGIPIIATNVGGVSEIVNKKTGILLSDNPKIDEIVKAIDKIFDLSKEDYKKYEENSYNNWKIFFNAENNYKNFIERYLL